jgi:tripartite-type tricarboxylate transporter receptor subunit TctC
MRSAEMKTLVPKFTSLDAVFPAVALALVSALGPTQSFAQPADPYPARAVTIVVPQTVGGANDTVARALQAKLAEVFKRPFVIENRPGAGGNLGTAFVAKATKDGYTLLLTAASAHTVNPFLYRGKHGFDPIGDFEPIAMIATAPYVLVTHPAFPARDVAELIAHVKKNPGKINYASAGNGTTNHLLGEMFKQSAGLFMVHIPYRGAAAAATDVVGGQIPLTFGSLPGVMPFVKSGQLKLLAVAEPKRSVLIPDVATIAETLPGFSTISWYGLFAPAGTPKEIVAKLYAETQKILANREFQERLAGQGAATANLSQSEFATLIRGDLVKMEKIVRDSKAQID